MDKRTSENGRKIDLTGGDPSGEKKVLFIAYLYPPAGGKALPGAQRTVKFIRYLPLEHKYLLSIRPELYPEFFTKDNSAVLPVNKEVMIRTGRMDLFDLLLRLRQALKDFMKKRPQGSHETQEQEIGRPGRSGAGDEPASDPGYKSVFSKLKDIISDIMTFPDYAHGWILPAVWKGRKVIKKENIDVVFATGMPWSSLLVGMFLKRLTHVRFIADFRDPWVSNPFATDSKKGFIKKMEKICEKRVVELADCVTLNTRELTEEFQNRYSSLPEEKFQTLINGYDPQDFSEIKCRTDDSSASKKLVISHIGFLYGLRDPAPLFQAITRIREDQPDLASAILFQQIGDTQLEYDMDQYIVDNALENNVINHGQLSYEEALQHMSSSDILLVIQPKTTTQIPSKIYEYIYFDKPIVTIGCSRGALANLIRDYEFGTIFSDSDVDGIAQYFSEKTQEKLTAGKLKTNYVNRERFDVGIVSQQLMNLISKMRG